MLNSDKTNEVNWMRFSESVLSNHTNDSDFFYQNCFEHIDRIEENSHGHGTELMSATVPIMVT